MLSSLVQDEKRGVPDMLGPRRQCAYNLCQVGAADMGHADHFHTVVVAGRDAAAMAAPNLIDRWIRKLNKLMPKEDSALSHFESSTR
jgi:hypothetical protein